MALSYRDSRSLAWQPMRVEVTRNLSSDLQARLLIGLLRYKQTPPQPNCCENKQ